MLFNFEASRMPYVVCYFQKTTTVFEREKNTLLPRELISSHPRQWDDRKLGKYKENSFLGQTIFFESSWRENSSPRSTNPFNIAVCLAIPSRINGFLLYIYIYTDWNLGLQISVKRESFNSTLWSGMGDDDDAVSVLIKWGGSEPKKWKPNKKGS